MSEAFLNENGLTRYNEKLLAEVDKRIASGGNEDVTVPTYEEILEAANRVSDVEVDPSVAMIEALQTAVTTLEANLQTTVANIEARLTAEAIPVGTVIAMSANIAPNGYILCDGSAVSRTTYSSLFAAIGTTYGSGDGSTTFNVPNLKDKFIQGSATSGTVKEAGLPNITGTLRVVGSDSASGWISNMSGTESFYPIKVADKQYYASNVSNTNTVGTNYLGFDASRSSSIYGKSTTVQPPALTMRFYIKH